MTANPITMQLVDADGVRVTDLAEMPTLTSEKLKVGETIIGIAFQVAGVFNNMMAREVHSRSLQRQPARLRFKMKDGHVEAECTLAKYDERLVYSPLHFSAVYQVHGVPEVVNVEALTAHRPARISQTGR